jgi:multidrug efflux system membrane fusion protein
MTRQRLLLPAAALLALAATPALADDPARQPPKKEHLDYTGRLEAVERVELRPRVAGYIMKVHFQEGSRVRKGDMLVEIDPRPYQVEVDKARAEMARAEAELKLAVVDFQRVQTLRGKGVISQEEIAKAESGQDRARAGVTAAKAVVELARLNLEFTRITAPIDGSIGRLMVGVGNLVGANDNATLATIVSTDPIYVYFDVPEGDLLAIRRLLGRDGTRESRPPVQVQVQVGPGDQFALRGALNFRDVQVNRDTGTVLMRAVLPNGDGALLPGQFARVRIPLAPEK